MPRLLGRETGQAISDPAKLIAPMLARFIAGDRAFAKLRKVGQPNRTRPSFDGSSIALNARSEAGQS